MFTAGTYKYIPLGLLRDKSAQLKQRLVKQCCKIIVDALIVGFLCS